MAAVVRHAAAPDRSNIRTLRRRRRSPITRIVGPFSERFRCGPPRLSVSFAGMAHHFTRSSQIAVVAGGFQIDSSGCQERTHLSVFSAAHSRA